MTRLIYCLISLYYIHFHRTVGDYTCSPGLLAATATFILFPSVLSSSPPKLAARAARLSKHFSLSLSLSFVGPLWFICPLLLLPLFDCVVGHYRSIDTSVSVWSNCLLSSLSHGRTRSTAHTAHTHSVDLVALLWHLPLPSSHRLFSIFILFFSIA